MTKVRIVLHEVKRSLTKLTTRSNCSLLVSGFSILAHAWNTSCFGLYHLFISVAGSRSIVCGAFTWVFVPSLPTLCFLLCISVTGACSSRGRGGSWLGCQVCQPLVQSPSWSWLPIVEAPGCFGHPISKERQCCLMYVFISQCMTSFCSRISVQRDAFQHCSLGILYFLGILQGILFFFFFFSKLEWEKFVIESGNAFPFINLLVTPSGHQEILLWDLL